MIDVHIVMGDDNGGPHAHVTLGDLDRQAESLTDREVAEWRMAARQVYCDAFGEAPDQLVVYVEEAMDGHATD
jgi:hypothetical protein